MRGCHCMRNAYTAVRRGGADPTRDRHLRLAGIELESMSLTGIPILPGLVTGWCLGGEPAAQCSPRGALVVLSGAVLLRAVACYSPFPGGFGLPLGSQSQHPVKRFVNQLVGGASARCSEERTMATRLS